MVRMISVKLTAERQLSPGERKEPHSADDGM